MYANAHAQKCKPWQIVANIGGCKFWHLSLYSNSRGRKINLRPLFSNPEGHNWVKILKSNYKN